MVLTSYMPTRILCGENCVEKNADVFSAFGKRALIVTGKHGAKESGALDTLLSVLQKQEISFEIFDDITENPQTRDCRNAGDQARHMQADFIVGIGGGSPLDAAKAVAIYASDDSMQASEIYTKAGSAAPLPVLLIGTTAGTGSEVTGVSVLTDSETGRKRSVKGKNCYAAVSFCDCQYTRSMPQSVRVSTALDAFAHAYESYLSTTGNDLSRLYAKRAIEIIWPQLKSYESGHADDVEYDSAYAASLYAGMAINITGTLAPHTLGYALTEEYHVPHGVACAVFAPALLRHLWENGGEQKVKELLTLLQTDLVSFSNTVLSLCDLSLTIPENKIEVMRERWRGKIASFEHVPGGFTDRDAVRFYQSLFSDR